MFANAKAPATIRGVNVGLLAVLSVPMLLALLTAVSSHLPPLVSGVVSFLSACPYRRMTGQACPLCGGMTALVCLIRGDLSSALSSNPFAVAVAPTLVAEFLIRLVRAVRPAFRLKEELAVLGVSIVLGILLVGAK